MHKPLHPACFRLGFAAVLLVAVAAHAQTVSPVPAPTIITAVPYVISTAGYYQLGGNLSSTNSNGILITIAASNVTLDFAGHYISGPPNTPASELFGVYGYERANVIVQNGTIANCYLGLQLTGNGQASTNFLNPQVRNMTVTKCSYAGISLQYSVLPTVADCRVSSIGGSTVDGNPLGIEVYQSTGGQIANCSVSGVTGSSDASGIEATGGSTVTATGNTIVNITTSSGTAYGILDVGFVIGSTINGASYGIYGAQKYRDNMTSNCTTAAFFGGTAVGNANN